MTRKSRTRRASTVAFDAITIEGSLIAPDMLARIATLDASDQTPPDYDTPEGLTLRDEIGRYFRIGEALWQRFDRVRERDAGGLATREFCTQLLAKVFGFATLAPVEPLRAGERAYPVGQAALGGRVPVVIAPVARTEDGDPKAGLDRAHPAFADATRRRSATLLLQEALNATDTTLWGLVLDGRRLRLLRDNASMTRPAHIEADLERIFGQGLFADFSALWLLIHQSRFGAPAAAPSDCALERWREAGKQEGVKARERLREGVEEALKLLGSGFLEHRDNAALRAGLEQGALSSDAYFQELLRLVYRLIFLFTAEDRDVLHAPDADPAAVALYARGYSLARLRTKAVRSLARDKNYDLFEGVRIVMRALERGERRLGLPALGGLFLRERTPNLDAARIENRALLAAVEKLAWLRDDGARVRVNWRDMETEELGSVYESLLELVPRVSLEDKRFFFAGEAESKGNARKTTGSYYTPDSLVQLLLDSALDPVIEDTIAANPDRPVEALLDLDICDPACGSGHFLLAAARRIATRIAQLRAPGSPSAEDFRHALREVARHCLYGVDKNPMAVELCKVALWIETVEPGKPLSFLDGRIRCGDSLVGVFDYAMLAKGIPDEAYKALTGDDKAVASELRKANKGQREGARLGAFDFASAPRDLAAAFALIAAMPEDTVDEVAAKARADAEARRGVDWMRATWACALYVSAFFMPKIPRSREGERIGRHMVPTTDDVWAAASGRITNNELYGKAVDLSYEIRAFHWPLEFADVMRKGGFDVMVGNPPWERLKLQEQEFFAARAPTIAEAPNKAARDKLIKALAAADEGSAERRLHEDFEFAKRAAEAGSLFARESGRFPLTGTGDVNTYALFAELFADGSRQRAGVIVPTGIATDATTAPFFANLMEGKRLARLVDFENRERIFPAVDSRMKFALMTLGRGEAAAEFAFFLGRAAQWAETERRFALSADDIARLNPNTRTVAVFRSKADAELTKKIYERVPVLIKEAKGAAGNPWGIEFSAMFHMSNDSHLFRTAAQLQAAGAAREGSDWVKEQASGDVAAGRWVPLYEAKMIHHFDHRWATYDGADSRDATLEEKAAQDFEVTPRYWIEERGVDARLTAKGWRRGWLMSWRDICRSTDERTVIAAVMPRVAVGHTNPLFFIDASPPLWAAFLASWSTVVFDYIARLKVGGTHLTYGYLKQLPVLPPSSYTQADLAFIVPRVLELTYTSHSMARFARDLGYEGPPFVWDEDRRAWLRAELDAYYARRYGLTREELLYILDPRFLKGDDYPSETFRVLRTNEERKFGEYRTARLVMQAWDEQARGARVA